MSVQTTTETLFFDQTQLIIAYVDTYLLYITKLKSTVKKHDMAYVSGSIVVAVTGASYDINVNET